jgi:hypothetical protein
LVVIYRSPGGRLGGEFRFGSQGMSIWLGAAHFSAGYELLVLWHPGETLELLCIDGGLDVPDWYFVQTGHDNVTMIDHLSVCWAVSQQWQRALGVAAPVLKLQCARIKTRVFSYFGEFKTF